MTAPGSSPPGWYADRGGWRWWDGARWGEWRAAAAPPPSGSNTGLAAFAHIGGLLAGFLVPLIIYLTADHQDRFLREQSAEALNFQITFTIVSFGALLLSIPIALITFGLGLLLVVPAMMAFGIAALVFMIQGAVAANRGDEYRYPINIRLVKP
jgi:hypothetical protein